MGTIAFLKLCEKGGPLLQTHSRIVGCWQFSPASHYGGIPLLILDVEDISVVQIF